MGKKCHELSQRDLVEVEVGHMDWRVESGERVEREVEF